LRFELGDALLAVGYGATVWADNAGIAAMLGSDRCDWHVLLWINGVYGSRLAMWMEVVTKLCLGGKDGGRMNRVIPRRRQRPQC